MSYLVCSELELASIERLRIVASETTDGEILDWLSYQNDPTIIENIAKNPHIYTKTIDNILNRLDDILEKIIEEDLVIPVGEVYPKYYVDFVESKQETYLTRICFACGWNPKISGETLHSLIIRPFKVLVRSEKYHRLNTLLLNNPRLLKKSWKYMLKDVSYISSDMIKFLNDSEALDFVSTQIITLSEKKPFLPETEIYKILLEFARNKKTSRKTIYFVIQFIQYRDYPNDTYNYEKIEEILMNFAIHPNIDERCIDLLVLRKSEKIIELLENHPNITETIKRKIEFIRQTGLS